MDQIVTPKALPEPVLGGFRIAVRAVFSFAVTAVVAVGAFVTIRYLTLR